MKRFVEKLMQRAPGIKRKSETMLGRWNLKHKCGTEDIVVLNANRDHCGDSLCGDPKEYLKLVGKKKVKV